MASFLSSISLPLLLSRVALKLRSLLFHSPRLCRIAVFSIQTIVSPLRNAVTQTCIRGVKRRSFQRCGAMRRPPYFSVSSCSFAWPRPVPRPVTIMSTQTDACTMCDGHGDAKCVNRRQLYISCGNRLQGFHLYSNKRQCVYDRHTTPNAYVVFF